MNYREAKELMKTAPRDEKFSRINKSLTRIQVCDIVDACLEEHPDDAILNNMIEKRVLQVSKDRIRI